MNKVLSKAEAEALLKNAQSDSQKSPVVYPRRAEWPLDQDKILIFKAATNKDAGFTATDGRKYQIKYKDDSLIYVREVELGMPCGWFDLDSLKNEIEAWI